MKKSLLAFCLMGVTLWSNAFGQKKVGIYTDDPKATLDVNGNVRVQTVPEKQSPNVENQLYWNKATGEVQLREKVEEKPFYVLEYILFSAPDKGHYTHARSAIYNYNTQIPSDKYEVLITDAYPIVHFWDGTPLPYEKRHKKSLMHVTAFPTSHQDNENCFEYKAYVDALGVYGGDEKGNLKLNPIRRTSCKPVNGKWHIGMEYVRATPVDGNHLRWYIRVLAINKNFADSRTFVSETDPTPKVTGNDPDQPTGALPENPLQRKDNIIRH